MPQASEESKAREKTGTAQFKLLNRCTKMMVAETTPRALLPLMR